MFPIPWKFTALALSVAYHILTKLSRPSNSKLKNLLPLFKKKKERKKLSIPKYCWDLKNRFDFNVIKIPYKHSFYW